MTEDELRLAFARAFLAQARSDWAVYKLLSASDVPACHVLHYLQMASEKLAKAYRLRDTEAPVEELTRHHTGFAKFLNQYLLSPRFKERYHGKDHALQSMRKSAERLARAVERLAPAIDSGATPENAEYPWQTGDRVVAPCEWSYPELSLLKEPNGLAFLKTLEEAFRDYDDVLLA
jgi:hypothetical protein